MHRASVVLLVTLAGVGALHVLGLVLAPSEVPIADLASREGARVVVAGQVDRPREAPWGGSFDLSDGVARVPVLTDGALPDAGAWLTVEGFVVRWRGALAVDSETWTSTATRRDPEGAATVAVDSETWTSTAKAVR